MYRLSVRFRFFFFSSRRRHTRCLSDWSSDVCSSDLGCITCHRSDTQGRGPNLVGLFGRQVQLEDGRTVIADENYIRESILNPAAKVVSGFKPIMPVFQGMVSEEQLNALVAYVKSLNQSPSGAAGNPSLTPPTGQPPETNR